MAGAILAASGSASAQYPNEEYPIPANPKQDLTAIERIFAAAVAAAAHRLPRAAGTVEGHAGVPARFEVRHQCPQLLPRRGDERAQRRQRQGSVGVGRLGLGRDREAVRSRDAGRGALHVLPARCARATTATPGCCCPTSRATPCSASSTARCICRHAQDHGRPLPLQHAVPGAARQPHDAETFSGYTLRGTFGDEDGERRPELPLRRRLHRCHQAARRDQLPVDGEHGGRSHLERRRGLGRRHAELGAGLDRRDRLLQPGPAQHLLYRGQVRRRASAAASTPSPRRSSWPRTAPAST